MSMMIEDLFSVSQYLVKFTPTALTCLILTNGVLCRIVQARSNDGNHGTQTRLRLRKVGTNLAAVFRRGRRSDENRRDRRGMRMDIHERNSSERNRPKKTEPSKSGEVEIQHILSREAEGTPTSSSTANEVFQSFENPFLVRGETLSQKSSTEESGTGSGGDLFHRCSEKPIEDAQTARNYLLHAPSSANGMKLTVTGLGKPDGIVAKRSSASCGRLWVAMSDSMKGMNPHQQLLFVVITFSFISFAVRKI